MITINIILSVYLLVFLLSTLTNIGIDLLNTYHLRAHGKLIPRGFEGIIDQGKLGKMNDYTVDNTFLDVAKTIAGKIVFLVVILSGLLPLLADILKETNLLLAGLIFFAIPGLINILVSLPFDYYHIFIIEEKYGFNTRTMKTWISDLLKSLLIMIILGSILLSLTMILIERAGGVWWIFAWLIFLLFQILISVIYPTIIAPIFNKFTPIQDNELYRSIKELASSEGLNIKGIFQMDAARRSRHTNAYLSGLGKTKRIVLYDTLLESHKNDEVLAVLAHEIGHLKKHHIRKQIIISGIISFLLFFAFSRMIPWPFMYESFGFSSTPVYAGLFLSAVILEPVWFLLSPIPMALSRRFEREADQHVSGVLKRGEFLISALKKVALDNLANLNPHPVFVRFNYSHPPIPERIRYIEGMSAGSAN